MRTYIRLNYEPKIGDFCSAIIADPTRSVCYIFDCDGIWSKFVSGAAEWGSIIGDIEDQEDLMERLNKLAGDIATTNIRIDGVISDLDDERQERIDGDIENAQAINNEATARADGDAVLENKKADKTALAATNSNVTALTNRVTNVEGSTQSIAGDLATERAERIAADEHDQEGIRLLGQQMLGKAERVVYYYDSQLLFVDEAKSYPAEFQDVVGHAYFNHDFVVVRYKDADLYLESQDVVNPGATGTLVFSNVVTTEEGVRKYTLTAVSSDGNYTVTADESPVGGGQDALVIREWS